MPLPQNRILPRHDGLVRVIIDTPQGSRNKYKYDEELHCFTLSRVLPVGMSFPHDFGYIPGTLAADGDALDVMVLVEAPGIVGCLMEVHLVGVLEAEQHETNTTIRNDRLIAVAETAVNKSEITTLDELPNSLLDELEQFFVNYNRLQGRALSLIARRGPSEAQRLLEAGIRAFESRSERT
jgi:inorganic pyrophosphatase